MITSALLWGFVADVHGRRKLLIYGFLADAICNIMCGLSQNFGTLLFFKFLSGFIVSGPYACSMSYYAEFHGVKDQAKFLLLIGLFGCFGAIVNPILAWLIIPQPWSLVLFDGAFVYNSWRIYLTVCALPTLIGVVFLFFFPESPKFLMSQGRNEEALNVFRKMYTMNTGHPPESYPIQSLENELNTDTKETIPEVQHKNLMTSFRDGIDQMKPLFSMVYLPRLFFIVIIQFGGMLTMNTLRLWLPQIFAILEQFDYISYDHVDENPTFCQILDISTSVTANETAMTVDTDKDEYCEQVIVDSSMYLNIIIISTCSCVAFILGKMFIKLLGNKNLLLICYVVAFMCVIIMHWSTSNLMTLILACLFVGLLVVTINLVISVIVNIFPTSLRTMAISLAMMVGRLGALLGNVIFPIMLNIGCIVPIIALAIFLLLCIVLTIFIPKPRVPIK